MIDIIDSEGSLICHAGVARGVKSVVGLMFKHHLPYDMGLLIKAPNGNVSIHGMFMSFPLDLVFIDKRNRVADIGVLPPYKVYKTGWCCKFVLELNHGVVIDKDIHIGDKLSW